MFFGGGGRSTGYANALLVKILGEDEDDDNQMTTNESTLKTSTTSKLSIDTNEKERLRDIRWSKEEIYRRRYPYYEKFEDYDLMRRHKFHKL